MHWSLVLIKLQVFRPIFKKAYFEEHLETAASACTIFVSHNAQNIHAFFSLRFRRGYCISQFIFVAQKTKKSPF